MAVGLAAGVGTRHLLRALRWHGASAAQLTSCIVAMGWLVFYVANAPLGVSGEDAGPPAWACGVLGCGSLRAAHTLPAALPSTPTPTLVMPSCRRHSDCSLWLVRQQHSSL